MRKYLFLFLIGFNFIIMNINAEENISVSLENRIQKTEVEIETVKKQYSADLKEIDNNYQEKERGLKKQVDEMELSKKEIEGKWNFVVWFCGILGISSIVGVTGYLINLSKNVDKKIKEKVNEKVSEIVDLEKEKIEEIVKKYDVEEQLKKNKKICILSINSENTSDIRKILNGFSGLTYKNITYLIDFNDFDLILINNNDICEMDYINNLIKSNPNSMFFYFGGPQTERGLKNLNFANSVFQLYGNLINTLRTQDLLNK